MKNFLIGIVVGLIWATTLAIADPDLPGAITCKFNFGGIDCPADASKGAALSLKEAANQGTNVVMFKVPDSGLSADNIVIFTAAGKLPKEAFALTGATDSCTSGYKYACVPN